MTKKGKSQPFDWSGLRRSHVRAYKGSGERGGPALRPITLTQRLKRKLAQEDVQKQARGGREEKSDARGTP